VSWEPTCFRYRTKKKSTAGKKGKKGKKRKVAVHDLSLGLHAGQCFGLLGPNGANRAWLVVGG
jgi:ABC-type multidrug transport system ATPase subunit